MIVRIPHTTEASGPMFIKASVFENSCHEGRRKTCLYARTRIGAVIESSLRASTSSVILSGMKLSTLGDSDVEGCHSEFRVVQDNRA